MITAELYCPQPAANPNDVDMWITVRLPYLRQHVQCAHVHDELLGATVHRGGGLALKRKIDYVSFIFYFFIFFLPSRFEYQNAVTRETL